MNYSFFYKQKFDDITPHMIYSKSNYDLLISAFNESFRVKHIFQNINAKEKHWLIFPEYGYELIEVAHLKGKIYNFSEKNNSDEDEIILDYFNENKDKLLNGNIAIDITGMLRTYIVFIVRLLKEKGVKKVDFIYSEPENYKFKEETQFSLDYLNVREIKGCLGSHNPETYNDVLIMGSGYDFYRIKMIAKEKKEARKIQVLGFPSLQADMFQQSILKSYKAEDDASSGEFHLESNDVILAPANDPFVTAELISNFIKKEEKKKTFTNIYICPLSTKAQALGMALYYTFECIDKPASLIFPFCKKYSRETSEGLSKYWVYTVEFP